MTGCLPIPGALHRMKYFQQMNRCRLPTAAFMGDRAGVLAYAGPLAGWPTSLRAAGTLEEDER